MEKQNKLWISILHLKEKENSDKSNQSVASSKRLDIFEQKIHSKNSFLFLKRKKKQEKRITNSVKLKSNNSGSA